MIVFHFSGSGFLHKVEECSSPFFVIISLHLCFLLNSVFVTVFPNSVLLTLLPGHGFYLNCPKACHSLYILQLNMVSNRHLSPITSINSDLQVPLFSECLQSMVHRTPTGVVTRLCYEGQDTLGVLISKIGIGQPNLNLRNQIKLPE